jgi:hypothetical protein
MVGLVLQDIVRAINIVFKSLSSCLVGQKMEVMEFKYWCGLLNMHGTINNTHISILNPSLHLWRTIIVIKQEVTQFWHKQLWMLGGGSPTSMLVYLGASTIFKFYKNLSGINKLNMEGFSIWWYEVKKVLHFTFLVIRGTCYSHESGHLTRMDNNILCLSFYIIQSINEGDWLWGKPKAMFPGTFE